MSTSSCHAHVAYRKKPKCHPSTFDSANDNKRSMSQAESSSTRQDSPKELQVVPKTTAEDRLTVTQENQEEILADKDINVRDALLPVFGMYEAIQLVWRKKQKGVDHLRICESNLIRAIVP